MQKLLLLVIFCLLASQANAQLIWFGKKMPLGKAELRWGKEPFDAQKFKVGDLSVRAKMAASLVRNKDKWVSKTLMDVRKELGPHDGFYFNDTVPAYLLTWGADTNEETWQIVFLPDKDYKVKDIIIELNGSSRR